jgi:hypothetical protein
MAHIKKNILKLLQLIQKELNNLPDEEIDSLLNGDAKLELTVKSKLKRKNIETNVDLYKLERDLRELNIREDGIKLLEKTFTTKEELEKFARQLDLPVLKGDKVDLLRKKIVEATIGYKLRSDSIQNK